MGIKVIVVCSTIILLAMIIMNPLPKVDTSPSTPVYFANKDVSRYVDKQAGVVCWIFDQSIGGHSGISCLPIEYTRLDIP